MAEKQAGPQAPARTSFTLSEGGMRYGGWYEVDGSTVVVRSGTCRVCAFRPTELASPVDTACAALRSMISCGLSVLRTVQ